MTRTDQDRERYRQASEAIRGWTEANTNDAKTIENAVAARSEDGVGFVISNVNFRKDGNGLVVDYTFRPEVNGQIAGRFAKRGRPFETFKKDLQSHLDSWIQEKNLVPEDRERKSLSSMRR